MSEFALFFTRKNSQIRDFSEATHGVDLNSWIFDVLPFFSPLSPPTSKKDPSISSRELPTERPFQPPNNRKFFKSFRCFHPFLRGRSFIGTSADPRKPFWEIWSPDRGLPWFTPQVSVRRTQESFLFGKGGTVDGNQKSGEKTSWGWENLPLFTGFYTSKRWLALGFQNHQQYGSWVFFMVSPPENPKSDEGKRFFQNKWWCLCSIFTEKVWTILRCSDAVDRKKLCKFCFFFGSLGGFWMVDKKMFPKIFHFHRGFPLFSPSILGYPYCWKHPYWCKRFFFGGRNFARKKLWAERRSCWEVGWDLMSKTTKLLLWLVTLKMVVKSKGISF